MCGPLFVIALLSGCCELWIGSKIAAELGWGDTLFILLCSCVVGLALCKKFGAHQLRGISAVRDVQALPKEALVFFIAAALFLFPGFLSDLCGYALLLKPIRRLIEQKRLMPRFRSSVILPKSADDRDAHDPSVIVVRATKPQTADSDSSLSDRQL